ncbi:suppressor of fused domain protein [Catenulispora sp. NF23]|uniref:Suppressor of fused domain protein n=1 Tax=Catenulispora pinistramenti TaxID=2705254 RepID=A0ABS5KTT3_9ACTN|nr:suppressor of fused domain protein [Catenulispora pinistramenti]MBS2533090.1 suppressor of fused domain protein [Catenulispora pinistramenti]MBS2549405.1 suppressor of fused domain protein [Catenulispora pinistramenti]
MRNEDGNTDRLLAHYRRFLGEQHRVYDGEAEQEPPRPYDLVEYRLPEPGVSAWVTNGLRTQPISTLRAQELFCFLRESQRVTAGTLTAMAADAVLGQMTGLEYDDVVKHDSPLIEGTRIHGVVAYPNPVFGTDFDLVDDRVSRLQLQIITLIPVTPSEIEFVAEEGADALWDVFRDNDIDILDINRAPAL